MPLKGRNRRRRVRVGVVLLQRHGDIILKVTIGLGVLWNRPEVDNEVILNREDGVDAQMGVIAGVDLVDDGGVVRVSDLQVDMSGPHGRAVHEVKQHTSGTVGGQRVRRRVVAVPPEVAVFVGEELAAQVVFALVGVLEVVLAVGGGLPDVQHGADDGLAGFHVGQAAVHVGHLAVGVGVLDDGVAQTAEGSVGRPEGTQDHVGGGCCAVVQHDLVGDLVDERLQSDHVAAAMAFVPDGGADPADGVDELHAQHPFRGRQLDLASELVNVLDQRAHEHAGALWHLGAHGVDDVGREVGVIPTLVVVDGGVLRVGRHFFFVCDLIYKWIYACKRQDCRLQRGKIADLNIRPDDQRQIHRLPVETTHFSTDVTS